MGREVVEVGLVLPGVGGLADDAAVGVALGAALDFLVDDGRAHEGAGVAGRIADLGPACRVFAVAVFLDVGLAFPGVAPQEFAVEVVPGEVDAEFYGFDLDDAFHGVQFGAEQEGFVGLHAGAAAFDGVGAVAHMPEA